ncbi:DUF2304 domain-containing protein [Cellulomonas sp. ES6]|uniref:DUF2304 domain-containing protein n=1 Tax=Cellulomonas sp. ES6 TaxID=3039384 RepID=UPI0019B6455D|nr:DUF2304 domain-containing protein [Cellulomonas sp. ES6]MBD3778467.1 DUF2304 domain-containing protein [Micrococcales bacterium]WHP17203.1 DUF2304 domain-containing protein [Cellulomonas sp. ES6]
MSGYPFALAACVALVVFLVLLLRTRRLREKYAITWIVVGVGVCVFGAFPGAVAALADWVGVQTPSNLLFALALIVLLLVCIQLSAEITTLEEETRTLAEEIALVRFDVERLAATARRAAPADPAGPVDGAGGADGPAA